MITSGQSWAILLVKQNTKRSCMCIKSWPRTSKSKMYESMVWDVMEWFYPDDCEVPFPTVHATMITVVSMWPMPLVGHNPPLDAHLPVDAQGRGSNHSSTSTGWDSPLATMNKFEQDMVNQVKRSQAAQYTIVLDSVHKVAQTIHAVQEQQQNLGTVVQNLNTQMQTHLSPTPSSPGRCY